MLCGAPLSGIITQHGYWYITNWCDGNKLIYSKHFNMELFIVSDKYERNPLKVDLTSKIFKRELKIYSLIKPTK